MQPRREAECALHLVCALFSKNSMVGVNIPPILWLPQLKTSIRLYISRHLSVFST